MIYYKAISKWKDNSNNNPFYFVGDSSIIEYNFKSLEDALEAAKNDGTGLREQNWDFYEIHDYFVFSRKLKLTLESLQKLGYLSSQTTTDNISKIYHFNS